MVELLTSDISINCKNKNHPSVLLSFINILFPIPNVQKLIYSVRTVEKSGVVDRRGALNRAARKKTQKKEKKQ